MRTEAVYPQQATTYLPIFYFLSAKRATRQCQPILHPQTWGLMLLASCWKRSLQHNTCNGDANGGSLPTANKYLFADLLLSTIGEVDEATSPYFASANAGIDASSALLEVLITTYYMQWGCKQQRFAHGKQVFVCRSFTFYHRRGRRGNVTLFCICKHGD